ncbi:MAG: hypothetical protein EAZ07_04250 [Cytophagales bacterium]|nr:MAG: hypothetical protein EAZ07_04250 [Cytophagales bacterium]
MIIHFSKLDFDIIHDDLSILGEYEKKVAQFCKNWKNHCEFFEVSTSGSSGTPKTINIHRSQAQASVRLTQKALNLEKNWNILLCLSIDTIAGKMMAIRAIELGMNLYVTNPSKNPFLEISPSVVIDFVSFVPNQLIEILSNEFSKNRINLLKIILLGGAPIPEFLVEQIQNILTPIYSSYGMTETVSHIGLRLLNTSQAEQTYHILPEIEVQLNENNCFKIRGKVTKDEWVNTSDVGEIINGTHLKILGRKDNVVNSGGIKIQIEEIEEIISGIFKHQKIQSRFIITSIPDKILGESLILIVEDSIWTEENSNNLFQTIKSQCPKYKAPKAIYFIQQFIETESQKIDRIKNKLTIESLYNF